MVEQTTMFKGASSIEIEGFRNLKKNYTNEKVVQKTE